MGIQLTCRLQGKCPREPAPCITTNDCCRLFVMGAFEDGHDDEKDECNEYDKNFANQSNDP